MLGGVDLVVFVVGVVGDDGFFDIYEVNVGFVEGLGEDFLLDFEGEIFELGEFDEVVVVVFGGFGGGMGFFGWGGCGGFVFGVFGVVGFEVIFGGGFYD